ncbi:MAG: hypothetical protein HXY38_09340 [Chloroflexi bacterium]|nr:hypothetical protein [Chloroflexota bacterium]
MLGAGVLLPGFALLFLTVSLHRRPERSLRLWQSFTGSSPVGHSAFLLSVFLVLFGWIMMFLPPYRLGALAGYAERLSPVIGWLAVTGAVTSALLLLEKRPSLTQSAPIDRAILRASSIALGILLLLGLLVSVTGLGIRYRADYWYGAGVPVLGLQVLFAAFAGALGLFFEKRHPEKKHIDLFIFLGFWLISAWFWAREPLTPNYFMPDTADNIIYPYSDGATFDAGAQYALIGRGILNGVFFERALYSVFLTYLHIFFGQDFHILMTAQAALFAVFPAVVYLLGREIHSRVLGISAGVLMTARGVNAIIAAKWIDTASPKMVLTDFPTAIGLSIFLLLLLKWFKQPHKTNLMLWAGAVFVLTFMVRSNVLTLLPAVFLFMPFFLRLSWKQYCLIALLALLGVFAVTLPWEIRNQSKGIPMYSSYYSRILTILRSRYGIGMEAPRAAAQLVHERENGRQRSLTLRAEFSCDTMLCSIPNHFLHNAVTAFVSLPTSPVLDDLWNTIKADTPFWKQNWNDGRLGADHMILTVVNLILVSFGVGSVWGRVKALALLPILVFGTYILTNSLGLTSGGRYIAPVDWIVSLYFMAGGWQVLAWLLRSAGFLLGEETEPLAKTVVPSFASEIFGKSLPTLFFIFFTGCLMPLSEIFFQPRYQVRPPEEILSALETSGLLQQSGYSRDEVMEFLLQPDVRIHEGRVLYPRYYPRGDGEQDRSTFYRYLDYSRLVFTLIGPYTISAEGVVIPGVRPPFTFHSGDAIVIGCWNTAYYAPFLDAVVVFYTSGDGFVYTRSPSAPLQCPLPEPK